MRARSHDHMARLREFSRRHNQHPRRSSLHLLFAAAMVLRSLVVLPHIAVGHAQPVWLHPRCANRSSAYASAVATDPRVKRTRETIKSRNQTASFVSQALTSITPHRDVDEPPWKGPMYEKSTQLLSGRGVCLDNDHGSVFKVGNWEYVRLWKCNNDGIRAMMIQWPQPKRTIRFTFVRDPLSRFVSAYRELEFRYWCMGNMTLESGNVNGHTFVSHPPGSLERAHAFLTDFFGSNEEQWLKYSPGKAFMHLCPYWVALGFRLKIPPRGLFRTKVQPRVFVGRLETFHESIAALGRIARVELPPPRSMGHHPSEFDTLARMEKLTMIALLSMSPEWSARVAERYRPDICLFRYNTTPCGDMSQFTSIASNLAFL